MRLARWSLTKEKNYNNFLWHIGKGLHALQDIPAHLDAGSGEIWIWSPHNLGYEGWRGYNPYDNKRMKRDPDGSWVEVEPEENPRWVETRDITYEYLKEAIRMRNELWLNKDDLPSQND